MKIEISSHNGLAYIFGFITTIEQEQFKQYLNDHLEKESIQRLLSYLQAEIGGQTFTLLKHISVEKELRGLRIGHSLMNEFLTKTQGPVLLICDNLESQVNGFSLQNWYINNFNFKETGFITLSGPFLIRL